MNRQDAKDAMRTPNLLLCFAIAHMTGRNKIESPEIRHIAQIPAFASGHPNPLPRNTLDVDSKYRAGESGLCRWLILTKPDAHASSFMASNSRMARNTVESDSDSSPVVPL